ncbi:MAG: hypothetical protein WCJ94_02885 [bacterium]
MKKFNFELQMASLIPEFINQFFLNVNIDQDSLTCIELEDLGDALKNAKDDELKDIKKFLSLDNVSHPEEAEEYAAIDDETKVDTDPLFPKSVEETLDEVDAQLEEVDSDYYHRYTPTELKYIFDKVIDNIDKIYDYYLDYASVNLTMTINFKMQGTLESNLVVEFLGHGMKPDNIEDTFYLPVKNALVSDEVAVRIYFYYDIEKTAEYEKAFKEITDVMNVKHDGKYNGEMN